MPNHNNSSSSFDKSQGQFDNEEMRCSATVIEGEDKDDYDFNDRDELMDLLLDSDHSENLTESFIKDDVVNKC